MRYFKVAIIFASVLFLINSKVRAADTDIAEDSCDENPCECLLVEERGPTSHEYKSLLDECRAVKDYCDKNPCECLLAGLRLTNYQYNSLPAECRGNVGAHTYKNPLEEAMRATSDKYAFVKSLDVDDLVKILTSNKDIFKSVQVSAWEEFENKFQNRSAAEKFYPDELFVLIKRGVEPYRALAWRLYKDNDFLSDDSGGESEYILRAIVAQASNPYRTLAALELIRRPSLNNEFGDNLQYILEYTDEAIKIRAAKKILAEENINEFVLQTLIEEGPEPYRSEAKRRAEKKN